MKEKNNLLMGVLRMKNLIVALMIVSSGLFANEPKCMKNFENDSKIISAKTGAVKLEFVGTYDCNESDKCDRFMLIDSEGRHVSEYELDDCDYNSGYDASEL
jgi:hypothetical protein